MMKSSIKDFSEIADEFFRLCLSIKRGLTVVEVDFPAKMHIPRQYRENEINPSELARLKKHESRRRRVQS
ncbi:MAG: hypothetical protein ABSG86_26950 [Thermoguttaceae bacterium]